MNNYMGYPKRRIGAVAFALILLVSTSAAPQDTAPKSEPHSYLIIKIYKLLEKNEGSLGDGVNEYLRRSTNNIEIYSDSFEVQSGELPILGSTPFNPIFHPYWYPVESTDFVHADIEKQHKTLELNLGEGLSRAIDTRTEYWSGANKIPVQLDGTEIILDPEKHTYSLQIRIHPDRDPTNDFVEHSTVHTVDGDKTLGGGLQEQSNDHQNLSTAGCLIPPLININDEPMPPEGQEISGQRALPWGESTCLISWHLVANLPPLELVVTSAAYKTWRPSAAPGPKAGTPLTFQAELRDAKGNRPTVKVKKFEWELVETSHEPGIAMNYPLDCERDEPPDLRFELGQGQASSDPQLQTFTEDNPKGYISRARIVPFDWGAWSILKVRVYLESGGPPIEGKYQDRAGPILLPLRKPNSYIADVWKTAKHVPDTAADTDDEEELPGGNTHKGDGFALYEEYRGWIVHGHHEDGDPKKQDFFVLNTIGKQVNEGISLFAKITGLQVHFLLNPDEMRTRYPFNEPDLPNEKSGDRVMNANRTAKSPGGTAEPQHGVILVERFIKGKAGIAPRDGYGRKPKNTPYVIINDAIVKNLYGKPATYLPNVVAHELCHSVGVDHHGSTDKKKVLWTVVRDANGVASFLEDGAPIEVYTERTHAPIPPSILPGLSNGGTVDVACQNGQHSGDATCVMRYADYHYYIPAGHPTWRIYHDDSEIIGLSLCSDKKGISTNNQPPLYQARYGDAAEGACKKQICVRDNAP